MAARQMQRGWKPNLLAAAIALAVCGGLLLADISLGFMPFGDPFRAALFGGLGGLAGWSVGYTFFPAKPEPPEEPE